MTVADKIRTHLKKTGWTAKDLALHTGLKQIQLQAMMRRNAYELIAYKKIAEWMDTPFLCDDERPSIKLTYAIRK